MQNAPWDKGQKTEFEVEIDGTVDERIPAPADVENISFWELGSRMSPP